MPTFVLVHGSWQGGWAWDPVAGRLRARGHRVLAPTLPGHHERREDRADVGHNDLVDPVLATLDETRPDPVVLVGHSLGGAVISQAADRRPDRVARLVYCAGFVLRDGEAIADLLPAEFTANLRALAQVSPDRSMPMPWELWRGRFAQTADERPFRPPSTGWCPSRTVRCSTRSRCPGWRGWAYPPPSSASATTAACHRASGTRE
jgi:pimeloyl-ACP methyl ester carboxylesterase